MSKELDLKTYIQQQWPALPKLTQQVIKEGTYKEIVQLALNKALVKDSEEYMDGLTQEVLFVLLKLQTPEDFRGELKNMKVFEDKQIETILQVISAQLFTPALAKNPNFEGKLLEHIFYVDVIQNAFKKLPQETQETIQKLSFECITDITARHSLNTKQRNILRNKTARVIVGLTNTSDFVKEVRNELGMQHSDVLAITNIIEKEIFAPVRDSLLKAYAPEKVKEKIVSKNNSKYSAEWKEQAVKEILKGHDPVASEDKLRSCINALRDTNEENIV